MQKLLFFGDSLTDMSRSRSKNDKSCYSLGIGYVFFIAGELSLHHPNEYEIINRGIGGNRISDLYQRYKKDVVEENPDVITILIGVNEILMHVSFPALFPVTPVDKFVNTYQKLIDELKHDLPNTKIIIMEPFVLPSEELGKDYGKFSNFIEYRNAIKELTDRNSLQFIPLHGKLEKLAETHGVESVLYDGIHTNAAGAKFIAEEWLKVFLKK